MSDDQIVVVIPEENVVQITVDGEQGPPGPPGEGVSFSGIDGGGATSVYQGGEGIDGGDASG